MYQLRKVSHFEHITETARYFEEQDATVYALVCFHEENPSMQNILQETLSQVWGRLRYLDKVVFKIAMLNIERNEDTLSLRESENLGRLPEFKLYFLGQGIKFEGLLNAERLS